MNAREELGGSCLNNQQSFFKTCDQARLLDPKSFIHGGMYSRKQEYSNDTNNENVVSFDIGYSYCVC